MSKENEQIGNRYQLFKHMQDEHNLILLDSEIDDITRLSAEINGINALREELEKLREENERLKSTPSNTQVMLAEAYHRITAENQKLREALEDVVDELEGFNVDTAVRIAKEALKGNSNE